MKVLICASATEQEAAKLAAGGPRRDFLELAKTTNGRLIYRDSRPGRKGALGRAWGPHIRQAWHVAATAANGDHVFADGEHIGIPLLLFLVLRFKFRVRVVMLGHFLDRRWKQFPLAVLTRAGLRGTLVVHSAVQRDLIARTVGRRWQLLALPYQVDTGFWRSTAPLDATRPLILAVGSEHRDYQTLVEAVRGLPVEVLIAAGSHWARDQAAASKLPPNVAYTSVPLASRELRAAYERAAMVVVPLTDVNNQSGVTTILEGMSMGRPVITTANRGQRECIRGPVVDADGIQSDRESARGPGVLVSGASDEITGLYVPVADVAALRAAILLLLDNSAASAMGQAARRVTEQAFSIEAFIASFARLLESPATSEFVPAGPGAASTASR